MNEFMEQLFDDFIKPYVQRQPKDSLYAASFAAYDRTTAYSDKDNVFMMLQFYAIHAFILGLRMGLALSDSLTEPG